MSSGTGLHHVTELLRLDSPAPKPQSLAFDGTYLWMGSRETQRLYAIDPAHWTVAEEAAAPGTPWGMTVVGEELRVVCGQPPDDNRFIRRFVPGNGFKENPTIACPDDTGSQLSYDGDRLFLSQFYNRRILAISDDGEVGTIINVPREIHGQVIIDGLFYVLTANEGDEMHWLTRIEARYGTHTVDDLALIPFDARSLAFDGKHFWTNHREADQIVSFTMPVPT